MILGILDTPITGRQIDRLDVLYGLCRMEEHRIWGLKIPQSREEMISMGIDSEEALTEYVANYAGEDPMYQEAKEFVDELALACSALLPKYIGITTETGNVDNDEREWDLAVYVDMKVKALGIKRCDLMIHSAHLWDTRDEETKGNPLPTLDMVVDFILDFVSSVYDILRRVPDSGAFEVIRLDG